MYKDKYFLQEFYLFLKEHICSFIFSSKHLRNDTETIQAEKGIKASSFKINFL